VSAAALVVHVVALAVLAPMVAGLIVRTKAWWSGRRGAPILQTLWDLLRLARKTPVYSGTTTLVFRTGPYVALGSALVASLVVPIAGVPPLAFAGDFVFFAYAWGLGRVALMLGALDTGSPFEGMGASREATFSTLLEPALFLIVGALWLASGETSLAAMLHHHGPWPAGLGLSVLVVASLVVLLQVESSRMPVDDPTTHLELTMVHEVMILDHSGPDLAALQAASAVKLVTGTALIAAVLVPPWLPAPAVAVLHVLTSLLLAVAVGTVESTFARLRLRAVPAYVLAGLITAAAAVLVSTLGAP
jgi:formate hydrogenlyase subunit 4